MAPMAQEHPQILTVAQLTRRIKGLLEGEIGAVWVSGEISNWRQAASGHAYFTLKDADSQLDAVMFKGRLSRTKFSPNNGLEVLARGAVTVYERRGNYQLVVEELQPLGVGALQLAYEKLKAKLQAEGLFEQKHKKPLPLLPRRIGVVTSPTGAAFRDILHVIRRRFANVHILLYPARVQGEGAAQEIAAGIRALDDWGVDVMIVGRGGGSLEDLWPFNEEAVARAIFAAQTPIISAVGHEIDFALADFVADLRAPTPSAAAEMVVRERQTLAEQLIMKRRAVERAFHRLLDRARNRLDRQRASFVFARPEELLRQQRQQTDECAFRLGQAWNDALQRARQRVEQDRRALLLLAPHHRLQQQQQRLDALRARLRRQGADLSNRYRNRFAALPARLSSLSPMAVLGRGYSLAWKQPQQELIRDAAQVRVGDAVTLWFGNGEITATTTHVKSTGGITHYDLGKET